MKRIAVILLLCAVAFQCSEQNAAPDRHVSELTADDKQQIGEATERFMSVWKQTYRESTKRFATKATYDQIFAEYRNRMKDKDQLAAWDEFSKIPEIQNIYKGMRSMMEIESATGRVNTSYWNESDLLSANVKASLNSLKDQLDYTISSMPNEYAGNITYAMLADVDNYALAVEYDTSLTTEEANHIYATLEGVRQAIPGIVDEQLSYADPEGKTQINWGRFKQKCLSVLVHMAYGALVVGVAVAIVVATGGAGAAALLASPAFLTIGSATFSIAAMTVAYGGAAGIIVGTAAALNDQCLSVPVIYAPTYSPC